LSNIVNPVATTIEDAAVLIDNLSGPEGPNTENGRDGSERLEHYLLSRPRRSSAESVAEHLSTLCESAPNKPVNDSTFTAAPTSKRISEKAFVSLGEIRRRLDLVERATGRETSLGVEEIGPSVFRLQELSSTPKGRA
ncbi:MAG: hypothetical protein OSB69_00400, partial [Alphaproteobacteria bacterium]|nr:hypothetical protein [Alphaproteobacteria bacterium]